MTERWDRHFLQLCVDHARMSKDPSTKVGAVIIGPDREPISDGFNGFPRRMRDYPELLADRAQKMKRIIHAEENAILNAARMGHATKGMTLYLAAINVDGSSIWGGPPCSQCTLKVIQAGIIEVVSFKQKAEPDRWSEDLALAREFLQEAGIVFRELEGLI